MRRKEGRAALYRKDTVKNRYYATSCLNVRVLKETLWNKLVASSFVDMQLTVRRFVEEDITRYLLCR